MAETKYEARLKTLYNKEIQKALKEELGLANINQVPKLDKVMVSCGTGKKREDKRFTETVELTLTKITGQAVTSRLAVIRCTSLSIALSTSPFHTSATSMVFHASPSTLRATTALVSKSRPSSQKFPSKMQPLSMASKSLL